MFNRDLLRSLAVIAGLAVATVIVIVVALPGVAAEPDEVYTGEAESYDGPLTVEVGLTDGEIVSLTVRHTDTPGIGTKAVNETPDNIVAAQSVDVDNVSGATVTAGAIKLATARALAEAGWSESQIGMDVASPDEPEVEPDVVYSARADSYGGELTVHVGFKDGEIVSIEVDHDDTGGIANPAIAEITEAVLSAQSADVDRVSGATETSRAVISAVEEAIAQAE